MEYVKLGKTGLEVSRICLGCMTYGDPNKGTHAWSLKEEDSRPLLRSSISAAHTFEQIDTVIRLFGEIGREFGVIEGGSQRATA